MSVNDLAPPDAGTVEPGERFSAVLRSATFRDHQAAATSGFTSSLFRGELPLAAYTAMVVQHWFTYSTLEAAGDRLAQDPLAAPFVDDALRRTSALEADLAHLVGPAWADAASALPATIAYCDRIVEVAAAEPERWVAHAYTRYLGDLAGGRIIGDVARSTYGLGAGAGADFYEFPAIDDVERFKAGYRERLDAMALDAGGRDAVLEEVAVAYQFNTEVFEELDRALAAGELAGGAV